MERRITRVAVVQALYQSDITENNDVKFLVDEFQNTFGCKIKIEKSTGKISEKSININFFQELVSGAIEHLQDLDSKIIVCIDSHWDYSRVEKVLKAILRAATYELLYTDLAHKIVINEYLEVTKYFYQQKKEIAFMNGVLNKIYVNSAKQN